MRYWILIIGLTILNSCQTKQDSSDLRYSGLQLDTVSITHKRYSLPDENPEIFEYNLIKEENGDSLLSFRYYKDTTLARQYDFKTKQGQFQLIQKTNDPHRLLVVVDTFTIKLFSEELEIYKYEIQLPPIDGDVGYLFNKKYGLIGYSAYSWGNKTILTNWNETDIEAEMKAILLADNVRFLRRQEIIPPPPPGQIGKIEIAEDTVEIELEEE